LSYLLAQIFLGFCVGRHCTEGCQADLGHRMTTAMALVGGLGEVEGDGEGEVASRSPLVSDKKGAGLIVQGRRRSRGRQEVAMVAMFTMFTRLAHHRGVTWLP